MSRKCFNFSFHSNKKDVSHFLISCRGSLSSLLTIFFETGILMGYILGTFLDYSDSPTVALAFPFIFFCSFIMFPSTPQFLLRIGKTEKAETSLKFYRNYKEGVNDECFRLEFEKFKLIAKYNSEGDPIRPSDFCRNNFYICCIFNF